MVIKLGIKRHTSRVDPARNAGRFVVQDAFGLLMLSILVVSSAES